MAHPAIVIFNRLSDVEFDNKKVPSNHLLPHFRANSLIGTVRGRRLLYKNVFSSNSYTLDTPLGLCCTCCYIYVGYILPRIFNDVSTIEKAIRPIHLMAPKSVLMHIYIYIFLLKKTIVTLK